MRLPAKVTDLALDGIEQSNPDAGAYGSTVQEISRGYLAIRKGWFEPLQAR